MDLQIQCSLYCSPCNKIEGWKWKRSKCFFTYIHLDLFCSQPSRWSHIIHVSVVTNKMIIRLKIWDQSYNKICCMSLPLLYSYLVIGITCIGKQTVCSKAYNFLNLVMVVGASSKMIWLTKLGRKVIWISL